MIREKFAHLYPLFPIVIFKTLKKFYSLGSFLYSEGILYSVDLVKMGLESCPSQSKEKKDYVYRNH